MLPRDHVTGTLARLRDVLTPSGWLAVAMVEADLDDAELPFLTQQVRLTGWPRDQLRQVIEDAGYAVEAEDARTYAPAAPEAPEETQLFVLARRAE
jgi:hypothetical protein